MQRRTSQKPGAKALGTRVRARAMWSGIACIAGFVSVCVLSLHVIERIEASSAQSDASRLSAHVASKVLAGDDWNERIRSETFWGGGRREARRAETPVSARSDPSGSWGDWRGRSEPATPRERKPRASSHSGKVRTVCVRLCDGYFFPINAATSSDDLEREAAQCERSCSSPARLFTQRGHSDDLSDLVDLKGQPYTKLKTANLFRTSWDESCKCKPHPWEQTALDRHRIFALEDQRRKGNTAVVAEITDLRSKVRRSAIDDRRAAVGLAAAPVLPGKRRKGAPNVEVARGPVGPVVESAVPAVAAAQPVTGAALPVGAAVDATSAGLNEADAGRARTSPAPRSRQASAGREGVMRLGASEPARAGPRRSEGPAVQRASSDWVRRAFSQN